MSQTRRYTKQEKEPASSEVTEVATGVLRMQLPISMPGLGHVNCYALEDERGVALVDPGLPGPSSWRALQARLADAGFPLERVHTVVVTHSHPDHFGQADRLAKEVGAKVVTHEAFQTWWGPGGTRGRPGWNRPTPWGGRSPAPSLKRRVMFRLARRSMRGWAAPQPTDRVEDGARIRLGGREWFVLHTPGHTLDHVCFVEPEQGALLSGDHVLPTITPHISGMGTGPDPLTGFLASLDRVAAIDGIRTVLPAHGHPFADLPGRVDDIKRHHQERLEKLRSASAEMGPATVEQLSEHLFARRSWGPMANSETYAHLEHLRLAGEAESYEENGRLRYVIGG
jgi:glyoxylase-like metal-dependent hydrolase (beta-lactamase superfamily II)